MICFWFGGHSNQSGGFSSFLFAERDETSVFWLLYVCQKWKERFVLFVSSLILWTWIKITRVVSDLFRCQEDVKPLRDLALCLLKERGRKMNGFGFICFWFGEHSWDRTAEVSVLSYSRKEMKPLFSDCVMFVRIGKKRIALFDFSLILWTWETELSGFSSFLLSGRCETTVSACSHACWRSEDERYIVFHLISFWFGEHSQDFKWRFQFFLIRGKRWNLYFLTCFMLVIIGKIDFVLFDFSLILWTYPEFYCGLRSFSLSGRCETTDGIRSHAYWRNEDDWLLYCFDLLICFWFGEHTNGRSKRFQFFLIRGKRWNLCFLTFLCLSWLERVILFLFILADFVDIKRTPLVVSDLFRCQEDVKPLWVFVLMPAKEQRMVDLLVFDVALLFMSSLLIIKKHGSGFGDMITQFTS